MNKEEPGPMRPPRQELGLAGEELAARHLESLGYRILERRYRTRLGELDLVATSGQVLVFVEVKARRGTRFGTPAESVPPWKQERLARVAAQYIAVRQPLEPAIRFDVVAVQCDATGPARVEHIEDAFRPHA